MKEAAEVKSAFLGDRSLQFVYELKDGSYSFSKSHAGTDAKVISRTEFLDSEVKETKEVKKKSKK